MTNAIAANPRSRSHFQRLLVSLAACRFLTFSILVHALIVLGFGGMVLYHSVPEPPDFVGGAEGSLVEAADPLAPPSAPDLKRTLPTEYTPPLPTMAPPPLVALVTTSEVTPAFAIASLPDALVQGASDKMKSAMAAATSNSAAGGGAAGLAGMGRMGGMTKVSFFGVKTEAKRIAFLVDYSGSMQGAFRKQMEEELERSLKGLPPGTQILVIPWAGGAWLYNQVATEISSQWQEIGGQYDNFVVRPGHRLAKPEWLPVNPENIVKLMNGVGAQKAWPGGTDWRSPFRYVMEANPPPDTIFFLTDGQIQDVERAFSGIDAALKKAAREPKIFALWIPNKQFKPDPMKTLAEKYHGEFREVGSTAKPM